MAPPRSLLAALVFSQLLPTGFCLPATEPQICRAVEHILGQMRLDAAATTFCSSFLSIKTSTTTLTQFTTLPTLTATLTDIITDIESDFFTETDISTPPPVTITTSAAETVYETDTSVQTATTLVTTTAPFARRSAKKYCTPKPAKPTPGYLQGLASKALSTDCSCLSLSTPTATVTQIVTVSPSTAMATLIESTTLTSDTTTTTTTTLDPAQVTTVQAYNVTQTIDVTSSTTVTDYTTVTPTPTGLPANGNFYTGFLDPWTTSVNFGSPTFLGVGADPRGSGYSFIFTQPEDSTETGSQVHLTQAITLVAGTSYTLTYDYMVTANPPANIDCHIISGGVNHALTIHTIGSASISPPNTWIQTSDTFTPAAAATTLDCVILARSAVTVYVDDLVITPN